MAESDDRIASWRKVIFYLQRHPEDFDLLMTMAGLDDGPEGLTFESDNARYAATRAINDDFLGFGHYGHCANCHHPAAIFPDRLVDWPLPEHQCGEKPRDPEAGRRVATRTASGEGSPPKVSPARPKQTPRGLDI